MKNMKNWFNSLITGLGFGGVLSESDKKQLDAKTQSLIDQRTASASARRMNSERGQRDKAHIGSRRIDRNLRKARKASNRYCNNLDNPGSVGHNPRRHAILTQRQTKQILAT